MKMTYFKKPDHNYYRVMFEFTDTEMKATGFEKLSFMPDNLEILRVLNRLAEVDGLHVDWELTFEEDNGNKTEGD